MYLGSIKTKHRDSASLALQPIGKAVATVSVPTVHQEIVDQECPLLEETWKLSGDN